MKVKIFQVKEDKIRDYGFMSLEELGHIYGTLDSTVYEKVYEKDMPIITGCGQLERVFEIFNNEGPDDYHGSSLSMGDIVMLDNDSYYCDRFGWKIVDFKEVEVSA